MIEGIVIQDLRQIEDGRGKVMHMLRKDNPLFVQFGEVYFSVVNPETVKAWKRHRKMTQLFVVPRGDIRLVIYDDRDGSPTKAHIDVYEIGEKAYRLIRIPPNVWYGFQGISKDPALIVNCADLVHDPDEVERCDANDERVPYEWK